MALTYSQISGITRDKFLPKLVDQIFNATPLLDRAKSKGWYKKIDGGQKILLPLEYAALIAAGSYSGADVLSTTDNETMTAAALNWKQYYCNVTISRRDELVNSGDSQIIDLVKAKMKTASKTLADLLSTGLYSAGSAANDIVGLRAWVDNANTVGGIDQSAYSWFQATEDTSTTTLTMSALQTNFNAASLNNKSPSFLIGTKANFNRYYSLLQPQQRFVDSDSAKAGFQSLMFNGVPFLSDTYVPSSHIFGLCDETLNLCVHTEEDFRFQPFLVPVNQNVKTAKIFWMGEFGISEPRVNFKMSAVAA
jgi:hypothetical protein